MRLKTIEFKNINQFKKIVIDIPEDINCIVVFGASQSGKTSLLKNIFYALSWFAARHKDMRTPGIPIQDIDMHQDSLVSAIHITVSYRPELEPISHEPQANASSPDHHCQFKLVKTRTSAQAVAIHRPDLAQLEQLVQRYHILNTQQAIQPPCIAYYPVERFVHDVALGSKTNGTQFSPLHNAYDLTPINFITFGKFFEWYKEAVERDNAHSAQLINDYFSQNEVFKSVQDLENAYLSLEHAYRLNAQHYSHTVNRVLQHVFPEFIGLEIQFNSTLQLVVHIKTNHDALDKKKTVNFMQLSQSVRTWIAIVGDITRRACMLNPHSAFPHEDLYGVVVIDEIDQQLDDSQRKTILPRLIKAFPNVQWIVSSLHDDVVDNIEQASVIKLVHETATVFNTSSLKQQLTDLYDYSNPKQQ